MRRFATDSLSKLPLQSLCIKFFKEVAYGLRLTENVERQLGMSAGVTIAHNKVDILAHPFSTKGCLGETGGHGKEINAPLSFCDENRSHLGGRHIDVVDCNVGATAASDFHYLVVHIHHIGGIGNNHISSKRQF